MVQRHPALTRTAYHEAGHAVAAYLRQRRFTAVSIEPDAKSLGQCSYVAWPNNYIQDGDAGRRQQSRVETAIITCLAGDAAETQLTDRKPAVAASADWQDAYHYATYFTTSDKEMDAYVGWLWHHTLSLLSLPQNWRAVRAVAEGLLERKHLGEKAARSLIASSLNGNHPPTS